MRLFPKRLLRHLAAPALGLSLLAPTSQATWSIVVCDTETGEVCVASATCLANFDLQRFLPVVLVGVGGAAAQSQVDNTAQNRFFIRGRMLNGLTPREIINGLSMIDNLHQNRQYGIVTLEHHAMTWTGANAGFARAGVTGSFLNRNGNKVRYALQGNVLAGNIVVDKARQALIQTEGDIGQKVMAAMERARAFGGDGRCSCAPSNPTGCGAPPDDFEKADHVAFIKLARLGDTDGDCNQAVGCANGSYYLDMQHTNGASNPADPVIVLRGMYADWRAQLVGRPDHLLSTVASDAGALPADGSSQATVTVQLVDVEGDPLMNGGAALTVQWSGEGAEIASPGAVTDLGNGQYQFTLTAGTTAGAGRWTITADDGVGAVRLHPELELEVQ